MGIIGTGIVVLVGVIIFYCLLFPKDNEKCSFCKNESTLEVGDIFICENCLELSGCNSCNLESKLFSVEEEQVNHCAQCLTNKNNLKKGGSCDEKVPFAID